MNQEDIETVFELMKERNTKEYAWIKQVISFVSIILGLIISLKTNEITNQKEFLIFAIAISSNAICILFGLGFLYSESSTLHSLILEYKAKIENPVLSNKQVMIQVAPKKIYTVFKYCFVIFLLIGILSLIAYSLYSSIPEKWIPEP